MPKYTNLNKNKLDQAVEAVKNGMPKLKASKLFNVPRSTIRFRCSAKFTKSRPGPHTVLSSANEEMLVSWVTECQKKGFPRSKEDLKEAVKDFLDENEQENPFTNNIPGKGWYYAFLKRHPQIVPRTPEAITAASSVVAESDIRNYFDNIEKYLRKNEYYEILSDPTRIYNGDETNFQLCPNNKVVLAPKGARNIYEVDRGQAKQSLTVMFTFSASGTIVPPMIIYPYKRLPNEIKQSVPSDWKIGISENGWMTKELFYEYISKILYPNLKSMGIEFPIILFVDGHSTHLTLKVAKLCKTLQIILIALYPNATHILQPADVAAFKPIKNAWKKEVFAWRRENPNLLLTREKFAPILKKVVDNEISPLIIKKGFRACGIYPFDKNAIDYSKCIGKSKKVQTKKDISFEDFEKVLGADKISKFKEMAVLPTLELANADELMLYKLYLIASSSFSIEEIETSEITVNFVEISDTTAAQPLFSEMIFEPTQSKFVKHLHTI